LECFGDRSLSRRLEVNQQLESILSKEKADLVWFHNIAGGEKWGWSEEMISIARQRSPVIWTLHDMWALGDSRESYWQEDSVVESGKWKGAGKSRLEGVCGKPGKYPVALTAPSRWLAELAKEWTGMDCVFLPNPIDLEIYSPENRIEARKRWGLPENGLVIMAGADSLADPRKGFDLLREAWESRCRHGATLALFGRHGENRPGERYLGNITSDEEMAEVYQAADLYVHPARMENAPCQIQESLACGTPAVAFAVGGIPEMIQSGENGFLATELTGKSLSDCMNEAITDLTKLTRMREQCRKTAKNLWEARRLSKMFEDLLSG
jgi:glycosyltransferase involved in cell wall biosynthesis